MDNKEKAKLINEICIAETKKFITALSDNSELTMSEKELICKYIGMAAEKVYKSKSFLEDSLNYIDNLAIYKKRGWN